MKYIKLHKIYVFLLFGTFLTIFGHIEPKSTFELSGKHKKHFKIFSMFFIPQLKSDEIKKSLFNFGLIFSYFSKTKL